MVIVAGASYYDPGQGTRGGSIILPSRFLSILIYFSIIFCGRTQTSVEKVLGLARTMTYRRLVPATVKLVRKIYPKKVRLTKKQMAPIEKRLRRLQDLEKWFITITPEPEMG
jgi:hypothetical protein